VEWNTISIHAERQHHVNYVLVHTDFTQQLSKATKTCITRVHGSL